MEANKYEQIELVCRCGKTFKRWKHVIFECPEDYMCPECNKSDNWKYQLRMLNLDKIRCVKCGWKLNHKNMIDGWETVLIMKCSCCGLRFGLWHEDY